MIDHEEPSFHPHSDRQHAVYRLFDAGGRLLYVGCSTTPVGQNADAGAQLELLDTPTGAHPTGDALLDTRPGTGRLTDTELARFEAKYATDPETGCWEWTAATNAGYGVFWAGGALRRAHRVSYEQHIGAIPPGLTLDHLCRNRACVNPTHLEAVTQRVNLLRGDTIPARNAAKTRCLRGHPLAGANVSIDRRGRRNCLTCARWRRWLRSVTRRTARTTRLFDLEGRS